MGTHRSLYLDKVPQRNMAPVRFGSLGIRLSWEHVSPRDRLLEDSTPPRTTKKERKYL